MVKPDGPWSQHRTDLTLEFYVLQLKSLRGAQSSPHSQQGRYVLIDNDKESRVKLCNAPSDGRYLSSGNTLVADDVESLADKLYGTLRLTIDRKSDQAQYDQVKFTLSFNHPPWLPHIAGKIEKETDKYSEIRTLGEFLTLNEAEIAAFTRKLSQCFERHGKEEFSND